VYGSEVCDSEKEIVLRYALPKRKDKVTGYARSSTYAETSEPSLMDFPPEIREMIYDQVPDLRHEEYYHATIL
jgi:hypothetical protein